MSQWLGSLAFGGQFADDWLLSIQDAEIIPVEWRGITVTVAAVAKRIWVLDARGTTWVLDARTKTWTIEPRGKGWVLSDRC